MIAFVIASLALAVLFRASLDGLGIANNASRYEDAVARARSRLAAVGASGYLQPGDTQGDDGGGFHWRLRIVALAVAVAPKVSGIAVNDEGATLYSVSVVESWDGGGRSVVLNTERVGRGRGGA
jgi:general secretion pathway protein I